MPHHQGATFQTKDLAAVALGERGLDGLLDEYLITEDGLLRRHVHEREWVEDPAAPLRGYAKSVRDWWEDVPAAHGDVVIYASDTTADSPHGAVDATGEFRPNDSATTDRPIRFIEFRIRFTNGRVQHVADLGQPLSPGDHASEATPFNPRAVESGLGMPTPDAEERLLTSIRETIGALEALLERASDHWGREDAVYRFYHQSFKVYAIQSVTVAIVTALKQLLPDYPLCPPFLRIVDEGTGKKFSPDDNLRWDATTRPMLEAFFHAQYFLEMVVTYGRQLASPPRVLPSGWAAVLALYGLR